MKHLKKHKQDDLADKVTKISVDYFRKNAAVYAANDVEKLVANARREEREKCKYYKKYLESLATLRKETK